MKNAISRKDKQFVIQKHTTGTDVHWDCMLEWGKTLRTYRLDRAPEEILQSPANAVKIFNHSLKFLTYQGPVNNGQGSIRIVEAGIYQIIHQQRNQIELNLNGRILEGKFLLTCLKGANWRFFRKN